MKMKEMSSTIKTYHKALAIPSFEDRFEFLKIGGSVGATTFGGHRILNQTLYNSVEWRSIRNRVIARDNGCDLACEELPIHGKILVHHIEPISIDDILNHRPCVFDLDNLICVSFDTHNAIHYGDASLLPERYLPRSRNDTCPWR